MGVKSLQEIASFYTANNVWSCYIGNEENRVGTEISCRSKESFGNEKWLKQIYPDLPTSIESSILYSMGFIDKELRRWESNICDVTTHFDLIRWTPFFTIDKVRSFCKTKSFDITHETLCACCFDAYVDGYRSNLTSRELNRLRRFFGDFVDHVILYWHWYGRQNRTLMTHINKYTVHYEHSSNHIENVFKLCVFIEYEVAAFHYWAKMKSHQQKMHHSVVIPLLVFESDYLDFVELKGLLPAHIFSFFWGQLSDYEKFDVVQYYFLDLYRYLLYHEDGVPLIFAILREWNPAIAPLEYFKLLRLANDTNNFDLFALLWARKLAVLSFEAIGHLMWTLLLRKDQHFKLSIMIINDYDANQKIEVLNELDKRIECVHFDFNDRIETFLSAASLQHLRSVGFPRNPKPRQVHRQKPVRRYYNRRHY